MVNTNFVSNIHKYHDSKYSNNIQLFENFLFQPGESTGDHPLAKIIYRRYEMADISKEASDIIQRSWRETTRSNYEGILQELEQICSERGESLLFLPVNTVLEFWHHIQIYPNIP